MHSFSTQWLCITAHTHTNTHRYPHKAICKQHLHSHTDTANTQRSEREPNRHWHIKRECILRKINSIIISFIHSFIHCTVCLPNPCTYDSCIYVYVFGSCCCCCRCASVYLFEFKCECGWEDLCFDVKRTHTTLTHTSKQMLANVFENLNV